MSLKRMSAALLAVLSVSAAMPVSYAGDLTEASEVATIGGLSMVAAPLLLVGGTAAGASAATAGIVRLVGAGGESMAELTLDALDHIGDNLSDVHHHHAPCTVNITVNNTKKEIPLVVRKEYVQMNQKID